MIGCSNCSSENESDSKFCKNCGSALIIHSNVVEVKKRGEGKVMDLQNREQRLKRAKEIALKTMNQVTDTIQPQVKEVPKREPVAAVHIGEKII